MLLRSDALLHDDVHTGYPVAWPPRTIVDLRDPGEQLNQVHPLEAEATVVRLPLLGGTAYDLEHLPASLDMLYLQMIETAAEMLVEFVAVVASMPAPVLVHCAAGKDRTGVSVALVLALLAVEEEAIVADYLETGGNMSRVTERMRGTHRIAQGEGDVDLENLRGQLSIASETAIRAVLGAFAEAGGAEAWYLRNGGDAQTLRRLRDRMLVGGEPTAG
jgi:protein-tyrosine phosphatase